MAVDLSSASVTGFLKSAERTFWDAESGCYNGAGARLGDVPFEAPIAGVPVPARITDCALECSGAIASDLNARCNRQGVPSAEGAGILVGRSGQALQGNDLPNRLAGTEGLSGAGCGPADILDLRSGAAVQVYTSGVTLKVVCRTRNKDSDVWGAEVDINNGCEEQSYPCVIEVVTESGAPRLIEYHWTSSQVQANFSDDEGATWIPGGDVLEEAISPAIMSFVTRGRLKACWNPDTGQILMVGHLKTVAAAAVFLKDILIQLASSDGGGIFQRVELWDGSDADNSGGYPDIAIRDGVFYVAFIRDNGAGFPVPRVAMISDAWKRIRTAESCTFSGAGWTGVAQIVNAAVDYFTDGELAVWVDDDLAVYVTARDYSTGAWYLARNTRRSTAMADWKTTGGATHQYWEVPAGGLSLCSVSATKDHGRTLVVYDTDNQGPSGQLNVGQLGGWSTLPLPTESGSLVPTGRVPWDYSTPWTQSPTACWFGVAGGAEVQGIGFVTATGARLYTDNVGLAGTLANGVLLEHDIEHVAGAAISAKIRARIGDAANSYEVEVHLTATQLRLYDVVAVGYIALPVNATGRVHVAIALTASQATAWWRPAVPVGHQEGVWTLIGSGAPAIRAGASSHLLEVEVIAASSIRWYSAHATSSTNVGTGWIGMPTNPTMYPRALVPTGVWAPGNSVISAHTGPAYPGDTWTIPLEYEYGPDNLDPRGDTPSPRAACLIPIADLPAGTTEIRLAFQVHTTDDLQESDFWGTYYDGLLQTGVAEDLFYAAAWHAFGTVPTDSCAVLGTSTGLRIVADPATTAGTYDWVRGDLDGASCVVRDAGANFETHLITRSRGGSTRAASGFPLQVELDSEPAWTPTRLVVWPRRALHTRQLGVAVRGFRITIAVPAVGVYPGRPKGGYYGLSVLAAGPVIVTGFRCAEIAARTLDPGVEIQKALDGTRSAAIIAPAERVLELRWDLVPAYDLTQYLSSVTGGVGIQSVAYWQDLDGMIELTAHEGALYPGVAIVDLTRTAGGAWQVDGRGRRYLFGRIVGKASTDPVNSSAKAARPTGWVVEEEV